MSDEGAPIAYTLLGEGVPVFAADGEQAGSVYSVLADENRDIFHGVVVETPHHGRRVVEADQIASLHERGVDLRVGAQELAAMAEPHGGAPVYTENPDRMRGWDHWVRFIGLRGDWKRERG